jgi:hypothetical protein
MERELVIEHDNCITPQGRGLHHTLSTTNVPEALAIRPSDVRLLQYMYHPLLSNPPQSVKYACASNVDVQLRVPVSIEYRTTRKNTNARAHVRETCRTTATRVPF